jgi:serine/threonine protein phosphatase 1
MRRLVIGDIHGGYKALLQVLEQSKFDYENDQLICLGDVADSWPQVPECFDELLKIRNLIYVLGNHDEWLYQWLKFDAAPYIWISQGGKNSIDAYLRRFKEESYEFSKRHMKLLEDAYNYYVTEDNKCFVHGGFDWHNPMAEEDRYNLLWDRHLFQTACMWQEWNDKGRPLNIVKEFDEVFIGHTTTSHSHPDLRPVHVSNVWNLDQGAGWEGKLTLMDVDSKEFWQSSIVKVLYPNEKGR